MFASTTCLVTGGTGFIGRFVVRALLRRGTPVRLLCRHPQKAESLFGAAVEIVPGDLREPSRAAVACRDVGGVIHLAGVYQFGRLARTEMFATNVTGTTNLLQAAWDARVERLLHVSSSGVLVNRTAPITERDFPNHVAVRQPYRHSKWRSEQVALEFAQRGLPVVIASPTSPLGTEDEAPTPTGQIVRDFLARRFPFAATTLLNFVDVAELAEGILAAATAGRVGERYILGHHNLWLPDFLQLLSRASGIPAPRHTLPLGVILAGGVLGELAGSRRLCWETAWHCGKRQPFDGRKAADELGWRASVPLETSARAAIDWFLNPRISTLPLVEAHATA